MTSKKSFNADYRRKNLLYLSFLSALTAPTIQHIDASENFLTSLDDFKNYQMPNLQTLNVACNSISNIEGLRNKRFPKLNFLDIFGNEIADLEPLGEMQAPLLEQIRCGFRNQGNQISDITPIISSFPNLKRLCLGQNLLDGASLQVLSISTFTDLRVIYLNGNSIDFIDPKIFQNFYNLQSLSIKDNVVTNHGFLRKINFPSLDHLNISSNFLLQISNISIPYLPQLSRIVMNKNIIEDIRAVVKVNWPQIEEIQLYGIEQIIPRVIIKQFRNKKLIAK